MAVYNKTPIPTPDILGSPFLGAAHLTEMIPDACSCGRPIGSLAYRYSSAMLEGYTFSDFANSEKLKMCCRSRILSPAIANVVSADRGARRIAGARLKDTGEIPADNYEIVDAPPPQSANDIVVPPPVTELTKSSLHHQQP